MAIGKARSNKRSSSSSRSSTLTTIILVALCIFGLWLLAPDTLVYPRTTTRTAATTSSQSNSISDSHEIHPTKTLPKKSQPVFQDSQGDLPEDAIQSDHETTRDDRKDESSELPNQSSTESEAQVETDNVSEQDSGPENNDESGSSSDSNNEAEADDGGGGGNKENMDVKEKDPDVGKNPQKLDDTESVEEQEKQEQLQTQNSEESSITQNQEAEETREEHTSASADRDFKRKESQHTKYNQATAENNQEETTSDEELDNHQSSDNNEHEISDEDQQKRLQQHQQQEDDQVQQGISQEETQGTTSHDQVEHDEAPLAQTGNPIDQSQLGGRKNPGH